MLTLALTFAPAVLLMAVLFCGLRPGEKTLLRLRERRMARPRRPVALVVDPRLPYVASHGDRLRAAARAVRPPPGTAPA